MVESPPPRSRAAYPLSALFVLMTGCAIITAFLAPVVQAVVVGRVGAPEAIVASLVSMLATAGLGGLVGLYHHRRLRGLLWGILTGGALGALLGPAILSPLQAVPSLIAMSMAGSVLLIVVATVFWQGKVGS